MKIKDIKKFDKNPRKITDISKTLLNHSMNEFGDISGILYNHRTKRLFGGHQRQDGFDDNFEITITKKFDKPTSLGTIAYGYIQFGEEDQFSYREVDWDEQKEIAANLGANKGAGTWDYGLLQEHINFLDEHNFPLDLTMFNADERENLFGDWNADLEQIDNITETSEGLDGKIIITCSADLKDEVLFYIKAKLLETSFEGVHVK